MTERQHPDDRTEQSHEDATSPALTFGVVVSIFLIVFGAYCLMTPFGNPFSTTTAWVLIAAGAVVGAGFALLDQIAVRKDRP